MTSSLFLAQTPHSPQLPFMPHYLEPQISIWSFCLTSSIIELSEGAKALLHKACKLAEEKSNIDDFGSASFDDFEEAKRDFAKVKGNYVFLNKNLLSDNDSDQESDWEEFFQPFHQQVEPAIFESNSDRLIDIDDIN